MDSSKCTLYAELFGFKPLIIEPEMDELSATSSSDEERLNDSVQITSTPTTEVTNKVNAGKKTDSINGANDNLKTKDMLDKILLAVRNSSSENKDKAVSIQKIKQYLRLQLGVRKFEMTKQLKPAMELALQRRILLKVTGQRSVLIGSVKLNPANTVNHSGSESSYSQDEQPAAVAAPKIVKELKKRKAGGEEVVKGSIKRLKI